MAEDEAQAPSKEEMNVAELTLPIWRLKGVTMRALCEDFALGGGKGKVTQKHLAVKLFEEAKLATLESLPNPPPSSPQRKSSRNVPKREREKHIIPNGTITLPVDTIKAETMRLICKDFGVSGAGKKPEAAKRLADSGKLDELSPPEAETSSSTPPATPKRSQKRKSEAGTDAPSAKPPSPKRRKTKTTRASKKTEGVLDDDAMEEVGNLDPAEIPEINDNEVVMDDAELHIAVPTEAQPSEPEETSPLEETAMGDSIAESFSLHADYKPAPAAEQTTSPIMEDRSQKSPASNSLLPTPSGEEITTLDRNQEIVEKEASDIIADIPEANEAAQELESKDERSVVDTATKPTPSLELGVSVVDMPPPVVGGKTEPSSTSDEAAEVTEPVVEPPTPTVDRSEVIHAAEEIVLAVEEESVPVGNANTVTQLFATTTALVDDSTNPPQPPLVYANNLMDVDIPSMGNGIEIFPDLDPTLLAQIPNMDPAILEISSDNIPVSIPPPQFAEPEPQISSMHSFFAPVQVFERSTSTNGNVAELIEGGEGGIRKSPYFGASTTA